MHIGAIRIRQWMRNHIDECRDPLTDEVDATHLAESACQDLDGWQADEIPEIYFEIAGWLAVADEERRRGNMPAATRALVNARDASYF